MTGIVHPARIAERKSGVASPRASRSRPPSPMAAEVTTLLQRYPHLREAEMDRLVEIYPQLAMLDVALMTNDEAVAPKLDHFVRDNKGRLRTPCRISCGWRRCPPPRSPRPCGRWRCRRWRVERHVRAFRRGSRPPRRRGRRARRGRLPLLLLRSGLCRPRGPDLPARAGAHAQDPRDGPRAGREAAAPRPIFEPRESVEAFALLPLAEKVAGRSCPTRPERRGAPFTRDWARREAAGG